MDGLGGIEIILLHQRKETLVMTLKHLRAKQLKEITLISNKSHQYEFFDNAL